MRITPRFTLKIWDINQFMTNCIIKCLLCYFINYPPLVDVLRIENYTMIYKTVSTTCMMNGCLHQPVKPSLTTYYV
jgi:hypothetical protein